jgi:hypothetical protein
MEASNMTDPKSSRDLLNSPPMKDLERDSQERSSKTRTGPTWRAEISFMAMAARLASIRPTIFAETTKTSRQWIAVLCVAYLLAAWRGQGILPISGPNQAARPD